MLVEIDDALVERLENIEMVIPGTTRDERIKYLIERALEMYIDINSSTKVTATLKFAIGKEELELSIKDDFCTIKKKEV